MPIWCPNFFSSILTEYTDHKVVLIIKDDALPQSLVFIVGISVMLQIPKSWKRPRDVLMRCPVTFLAIALSRSRSPYLQKKHWIIHNAGSYLSPESKKVIRHSLKSLEDIHMRGPKTYFDTVLWRLMSPNLKKTQNYIQYMLLFVTGM